MFWLQSLKSKCFFVSIVHYDLKLNTFEFYVVGQTKQAI